MHGVRIAPDRIRCARKSYQPFAFKASRRHLHLRDSIHPFGNTCPQILGLERYGYCYCKAETGTADSDFSAPYRCEYPRASTMVGAKLNACFQVDVLRSISVLSA